MDERRKKNWVFQLYGRILECFCFAFGIVDRTLQRFGTSARYSTFDGIRSTNGRSPPRIKHVRAHSERARTVNEAAGEKPMTLHAILSCRVSITERNHHFPDHTRLPYLHPVRPYTMAVCIPECFQTDNSEAGILRVERHDRTHLQLPFKFICSAS